MKNRTCLILSLLLFMGTILPSWAVIATPEPIPYTNSDGSIDYVYLRGDEYGHYLTTLSGKIIEGSYVGADINADTIRINHKNAPQKELVNSYVPSSGTIRIPVVLVNFTDEQFTLSDPVAKFKDFFNGKGGSHPSATGSVQEYFKASSNNALTIVYDVFGPYNLSHDMAYYGANTSSSHDKNVRELVIEAASLASAAGVDFSIYDNDFDGNVDNISIIVAGHNEAEGASANTIWPHYNMVNSSNQFSGKYLKGYLVISEYCSSKGNTQAGIGTYCHEFGHALGLPDLYNTVESKTYTVGSWDVMCTGSYNNSGNTPPTYTAFERFAMGWLKPEQLSTAGLCSLLPIETSNKAYLIASSEHNLLPLTPSPNEYFLIENRQAIGWDSYNGALVGTGMMISHITFSYNNWQYNTFNNSNPLGYAIVSANVPNPIRSTPADLFPGTGDITSWMPTYNDGTVMTSQAITNIKVQDDNSISFRFGQQANKGFFFIPEISAILTTTYDGGIVSMEVDTVSVVTKNIESTKYKIYCTSQYFEYSIDNGETWHSNADTIQRLIPENGYDSIALFIRYIPRKQECTSRKAYITVESEDEQYANQLQIEGYSPRPIYIHQPQLLDPINISSTSFTAQWEPQEDADFYYLTLYYHTDEQSTYVQDFSNFATIEDIQEQGWNANFADQTQTISYSGKAIAFTQTGQQITSCPFPSSPSSIHFWVSNNLTSTISSPTTGGIFKVEGWENGLWHIIANVPVKTTTKNVTKQYFFSEEKYTQFRITYEHEGGNGSCVIDDFTATFDKTTHYICRGTERELSGSTSRAIFRDLIPSTTYYFAVQAYEYKEESCEEHFSPLSVVQVISTLSENNAGQEMVVQRTQDGQYFVELPEIADGLQELLIFNLQGELMESFSIPYGSISVFIPTQHLLKGDMYILKLKAKSSKLQRKSAYGKMIY